MRHTSPFLILWVIFLSYSPLALADMKAKCLSPENKWKVCHIDFESSLFKWRLKNQTQWVSLPGSSITRLVEKGAKEPDNMVINLPIDTPESADSQKAALYVPIQSQVSTHSLLGIEYSLGGNARKWLFVGLSERDTFVVRSKLESISGRGIE